MNKESRLGFKWYPVIFAVFTVLTFIAGYFFNESLSKFITTLLILEFGLLLLIAWGLAAHAVIKSLFVVSAELTFILFIAQSYCATEIHHTANASLETLIGVGVLYVGFEFCRSVYKEAISKAKTIKEINEQKWPWLAVVPFALFTGLFVWQVAQVIVPIMQGLCVYKP